VCTERCSVSRHWHAQVRPRLVKLAAWGIALARHPRTYPLQTGSYSASLSAVQGSRVHGRLLYTSLRHSQPTSFTVSHSTSPDRTTLMAQHFRSSGLLCRRSDGLELATRQSVRPSVHQQQLPNNRWKRTYFVATSTQSAVEMLHDSELYKSTIDVDIDINMQFL